MRYLGRTDLLVSALGLGASHFGTAIPAAEAFALLDAFCAAGGNLIDTANVYGRFTPGCENESERVLGAWLRSRGRRDVIIATKGGHYAPGHREVARLDRRDIEADLHESLCTLGLDCLPLYWLHRDDPTREIGEIIEMMEELVLAGKIRYYGASNYTAARLRAAAAYAKAHGYTGFSAVSNQHSPATLNRGRNTNPDPTLVVTGEAEWAYHVESGMPLIPFEATARGYFAKLAAGESLSPSLAAAYDNEKSRRTLAAILALAEEKQCAPQAATLVYTARAPFQVIPLTSARDLTQLVAVTHALQILDEN